MRFVSLLVIVTLCGTAWSEETALRVMTFNVRNSRANDGPNAWECRKEIFAEAIRQQAPDILGTQECYKDQADFIAQSFPECLWLGVGRDADGGGEMMAMFYRSSMLTPLESGHFWLSETPDIPGSRSWDTNCTRMVSWVRFRHLKTGQIFHYMNTHFDHVSEQARVQSAKLILEKIKAVAPPTPVILTGDFNAAGETGEPWQILTQGGLQDAWLAAAQRSDPEFTTGRFKSPTETDSKERIDWVLFRGAVTVQEAETVVHNRDGRYPSDHYPVRVSLRLSGETASK